MYNKKVMSIFQNPNNVGAMQGANGVGKSESNDCGELIKLFLKINEDGIVEDVKFKAFGCVATIASASVATDLIKNQTIKGAMEIGSADIIQQLGELPENKKFCAILAESAIQNAIDDYYKRLEKLQKNNLDDDEQF